PLRLGVSVMSAITPRDKSAPWASFQGKSMRVAFAQAGWRALVFMVLGIGVLAALAMGVAVGAIPIPVTLSARILLNATGLFHFHQTWPDAYNIILIQLRLPQVVGAGLVGAALAVAGALLQGLLRNPLADPAILGTSSGAALGASLSFLFSAAYFTTYLGFSLLAVAAFIGAVISVSLVYGLATRHGRTPVASLLLAGVTVSAVFSALQTLIITLTDHDGTRLRVLYLWISGGIAVASPQQLAIVALLLALGLAIGWLLAPRLDALATGEEMASFLGIRVEITKLAIVLTASALVAAAVTISGLVGFVGLVVPHVMRLLLGPKNRWLLPASTLGGAIFVMLADMLARSILAPSIVPLGVVTALVGGPFFLWLLRQSGGRYQW
ncbi:MAG TPA: iron ABC transporter permease, partial [Ktedonobacterales bacterium]